MKKQLSIVAVLACLWACNPPKPAETKETAPAAPQPVELTDQSISEVPKLSLAGLTKGDIDSFLSGFADNSTWVFNNGDSIAGKEAITKYWKDRRTNIIEKIEFSNDVWLAIQVNQPANKFVLPGKWVFGWYMTSATYKTGKSMRQWIHTDYHFNSEGKIDRVIQYLDREPIMKAMTK